MADSVFWRPDFDPAATFIVAAWPAGFTVRGVQPKRGSIFDKHSVPPNMLRAHYQSRWIDNAPAERPQPIPQPQPEPSPVEEPPQIEASTPRRRNRAVV